MTVAAPATGAPWQDRPGAEEPGPVTALLALSSALLIGAADFLGGTISRRAPAIRVAALAQLAGLVFGIPVALLVDWERVTSADLAWSAVAGLVVAIGIWVFYVAMTRGLISLVAPVTAVTGASVPVVYGLARGERPGATAFVGIVLALAAIGLVSLAPGQGETGARVVALAVLAGLLFGVFYVAFARVDEDAGLWPIPLSRVTSALVLVVLAAWLTRGLTLGRSSTPAVFTIGLLEVSAGVTLLLAIQRGPVSIAAVLASLYPVSTVLLAAGLLHERLNRTQLVGVGLALLAIVLVSLG